MNIADAIITVLLVVTVLVGTRIGALWQAGLSIGIIVGCFVAAIAQFFLGPLAVQAVGAESDHLVFWFILVGSLLVIGLGADCGWSLGEWFNKKFKRFSRREIWLSKLLGGLTGGYLTV